MIPVELEKYVLLVPPQLKDNGAPAGLTYADTKGWGHIRVLVAVGTTDIATTAAPLLQSCDTSGGSYANITSAALADAIADDEDGLLFAIDVDLTRGDVGRYVKMLNTAGDGTTGTNLAVLGILSRPMSGSNAGLAADSGLTELISV